MLLRMDRLVAHYHYADVLSENMVYLMQVPADVASRTIDFVYDPDTDTADEVAEELGNQFDLSSTDRDICAAALKEWLAKELSTGS